MRKWPVFRRSRIHRVNLLLLCTVRPYNLGFLYITYSDSVNHVQVSPHCIHCTYTHVGLNYRRASVNGRNTINKIYFTFRSHIIAGFYICNGRSKISLTHTNKPSSVWVTHLLTRFYHNAIQTVSFIVWTASADWTGLTNVCYECRSDLGALCEARWAFVLSILRLYLELLSAPRWNALLLLGTWITVRIARFPNET